MLEVTGSTIAGTYLPRYSIVGAGKSNAKGLTMYEAVRDLTAAPERGDDTAHIQCEGRYVAFWSEYHGTMRPMKDARADERDEVLA